ncbi:bacteriocin immunity protein [Providencia manganoxydans]|nr:bacteriocin immunity protein [Providencia stuartii]ELR5080339.1 bacteriocin immunity protein [Providencia stuartii]ELR5084589.1 bacteriocin immunity protein [Providencia stuartii]
MIVITKNSISDYTEKEFLRLIENIYFVNTESEEEHRKWVNHFSKIIEHPRGNGLIYYPNKNRPDTPEGGVQEVKEWRAQQGKPGFKVG